MINRKREGWHLGAGRGEWRPQSSIRRCREMECEQTSWLDVCES